MSDRNGSYDVVVAGGGIVGLAAALALRRAGHSVAVVEPWAAKRRRGRLGFDARTVALSPASVTWLRSLGGLPEEELTRVTRMRVWEHDGAAALTFTRPDGLAWVVEHSALVSRLWQAASQRLTLIQATVVELEQRRDEVALRCRESAGGERMRPLRTRLLVAADGGDSAVRRLAGVGIRQERQGRAPQYAIATLIRTARPHGNTAWQRFGSSGPVALLPVGDSSTFAVIWSTAQGEHERLAQLDDDGFRAALAAETEGVAGAIECVDQRFRFPLRQTLATDFNPAPGIILAGDAARTLHPLAGQGVNIGLEDAHALAAVAGETPSCSLASPARWRSYAQVRRTRSKLMLALMRTLLTAYCGATAGNPWRRLARNTAVRWIDSAPTVKAQLVREACGFGPLATS